MDIVIGSLCWALVIFLSQCQLADAWHQLLYSLTEDWGVTQRERARGDMQPRTVPLIHSLLMFLLMQALLATK